MGCDFHPLLSSSLSEARVQRAHRALGLIRFLSTDAATCPELSRTSQPGTDTFSLASEASLLTQVGVTCVTCVRPKGGCGAEWRPQSHRISEGKGILNIVNPKHSFSRGDTWGSKHFSPWGHRRVRHDSATQQPQPPKNVSIISSQQPESTQPTRSD